MKTVEERASNYFNNDEPDLRETLTDVRNEAFDAAIEAVEKAYEIEIERFEQYGEISIGTGSAIKAIEELKEKK